MSDRACDTPRTLLLSVGLVSAALIAYEIVWMGRLLLERWHHFGFLVISVALLGFGVSGTFLALAERWVRARPAHALWWSALGLAAALVVLPRVTAALPVTARFIPADLWRQAGWWSLYWAATALPFWCGAVHIGSALMTAGPHVGRVYAVSLFGSGLGALGGALLVSRLPVEFGMWPSLALTLLAAASVLPQAWARAHASDCSPSHLPTFSPLHLPGERRAWGTRARIAMTLLLTLICAGVEARWPARPAYDEYKQAALMRRLAAQGSARQVARAADPHGYVEVYESDLFHDLPFLALRKAPPPMLSVLVNGDAVGSIFRIRDATQADVMDHTLMAFPYQLLPPQPRVLLLGEIGGTNVWLARRRGAEHLSVVQPNAALVRLLRGPLAETAGHVLDDPRVAAFTEDPRAFLRHDTRAYELIQIVSLEGLGVGATGVRGLAEDHLATVEGLAACLRHLSDTGVLSVCRGIQSPERENIRLLATLVEALESIGVGDAGRHIVQVRDYLGVCTLALRAPLDEARRERLRAAIGTFNLTPVWYDGLPPEDVNRPDALDGPPGTGMDWLHYAAREILSPRRAAFYRDWLARVEPPRDDRPFFWDFYKPEGLAAVRAAYGELWLTRAELGRLFLYASLAIAGAASVLLILGPLAVVQLRRRSRKRGLAPTPRTAHLPTCSPGHFRGPRLWLVVLYFGGIGVGFMGIEMALISRAIGLLGDPVTASAAVIGGLLVLSGVGSLIGGRARLVAPGGRAASVGSRPRLGVLTFPPSHLPTFAWPPGRLWGPPAVVGALTVLMWLIAWGATEVRQAAWLGLFAIPLAYAMGIPMPRGIAALDQHAPRLVPWAWGVNGVASVVGTSLALVVAMDHGYRYVVALAAALYALAAASAWLWRRSPTDRPFVP